MIHVHAYLALVRCNPDLMQLPPKIEKFQERHRLVP